MNKHILILIVGIIFTSMTFAQGDMASHHYMDPYNPEFEPNEILVKFNDDTEVHQLKSANGTVQTGMAQFDQFAQKHAVVEMEKVFPNAVRLKSAKLITINGETIEAPQLHNIYKLKAKSIADMKSAVAELQAQSNVEFSEPNYYVYSQGNEDVIQTNDPLISSQWHLQAINAQQAWNKEPTGGAGQIISIIDTGVDWTHPDLDDNIWTNDAELNGVPGVDDDGNGFVDDVRGWDWVNQDNNPMDDNSHGTHVAGIAAAEKNNAVGISGVAFGAKIMPLKVLQSSGRGNSSDLAAAITYSAENGATVINMSLGSYGESLTVKAALEDAYSTALPIAAAGNDCYALAGNECKKPVGIFYPASYCFVLGVQATGQTSSPANCVDNWLTSFSNFDPNGPASTDYNYEIKAPGGNINSTIPRGSYKYLNGTSMAAPVVAGTIALLKTYQSQSHEELFARLIQSQGNTLDASNAMDYTLAPDLHFVSYTLIDDFDGGDTDNAPDAGETIEIWLSVRNLGGFADSVYANLLLGEFEDLSVVTIQKSTQYFGDISTYGTLSGETDSFKIIINPNVINDRDIVFEYEIGCKNSLVKSKGNIVITVQNGEELLGVMDSTLILTPNKLWLVNGSFRIGYNGKLVVNPGTTIILNNPLVVSGELIAIGKMDSLIVFNGPEGLISYNGKKATFKHCHFLNNSWISNFDNCLVENCEFININRDYCIYSCNPLTLKNSIFINNNYAFASGGHILIEGNNFIKTKIPSGILMWDHIVFKFNNFSLFRNTHFYKPWATIHYNNFLSSKPNIISVVEDTPLFRYFEPNYWGTACKDKINDIIIDFIDNAILPQAIFEPFLNQPTDSAHGCVWKVEVNEIDPQDEHLDPVGVEELKFDVYFNKCMDTLYTPQLSFGVREPYTQRIVTKNSHWSADSTIWTAYYDVSLDTGDGINQIRVTEAVDTAGFEIPIEVERFQFIIQAAGSASLAFQATPGIGKVNLEWPSSNTDDVLGYNLYRCYNLTDSTYSDTIMINTSLIIDTTFVDTQVIPDTTYQYLYKTVGTDMQETDYSKSVAATPFNAANGDANGDLSVNVADIITIVNYLLGNNPQPFLMDAADVNYDGDINVLDIVSVVNIIMAPAANGEEMNAMAAGNAEISIENDTVYVNSTAELAGLQFTLADITASEEVKVLKALSNFEVIRSYRDGKLLILAYSLSGQVLPVGKTAILSLSNPDGWIFDAVLSNTSGNALDFDILENATATPTVKLTYGFQLGQNYPNPFTNSTIIPFTLELEVDEVILSIYDVTGKQIKTWQLDHPAKGEHKVEWQTSQKPGIYIYNLNVLKQGHSSFYQSKRMIVK